MSQESLLKMEEIDSVLSVAFSPAGKRVASAGHNGGNHDLGHGQRPEKSDLERTHRNRSRVWCSVVTANGWHPQAPTKR